MGSPLCSCFSKPEAASFLLKPEVTMAGTQGYAKKRFVWVFFTLVIRLRTKLISGSLSLSDTECNINLSVCGIKEIGGLSCGTWSVVLGISTWTLIAAGVLFLEALRSNDPKVLICCLLGQRMGEPGVGTGQLQPLLHCQHRAGNGGTWEFCLLCKRRKALPGIM